ncbi:MAG: LD-carboxypeptidase [Bacteroidota bacterium]
MTSPSPLKPGSKVAIVAPARKVTALEMQPAIELLQSWGLEVVKGMYLFGDEDQYSGSDQQRWADFQMVLDDASIDAVIFARGGYGFVRIIDKLDFTKFMRHPKWLIGFSDVTVLHNHVNRNLKVETIHAPMAINIPNTPKAVLENLHQLLTGNKVSYQYPAHFFNRRGKASGELVGGNLSLIHTLAGTPSDLLTKGKILFLEDLDEYLYHIDRMMLNLKRSGKLHGLKALVIGGMTDMKDNAIPFGKSAEEIILDAVKEYDYPVAFGISSGHIERNEPLVMGRKMKLTVGELTTLSDDKI